MKPAKNIIGVFGGTFDPVHQAHITLADELYRHLPFKEIRFIPCKIPVLKAAATASQEDRVAMLQLAIKPYPHFVIDQRELQRDTPSYMVDTLQSLRTDYPDNPLVLILGMDALQQLPEWHQWQQLPQLAHLLVVNRPGYHLTPSSELATFIGQYETNDPEQLNQSLQGKLLFPTTTQIDIASTTLREELHSNEDCHQYLPPGVWEYIRLHHLYL